MKESKSPEIRVEKIMKKIKKEVEKRRPVSGNILSQTETKIEIRNSEGPRFTGDSSSATRSDRGILWRYGTKYAAVIKKIPLVNKFAEKYYWKLKLSGEQKTHFDGTALFRPARNSRFDIESNLNYFGFLGQIRYEGLKGRIKRLIFHVIGFFAWWQGQINKALYDAIARLEAQLAQQAAQINDQEAQLANKDKTIADLDYRLSVMSRLEDSLYEELTDQRAEIARQQREIAEQISRQKDS